MTFDKMRKLTNPIPQYTQECIEEVEEMKKHPLSQDEFSRQIEENRRRSELRKGREKTYTMYASGLITSIVCVDCNENPCPRQNWLAKNECTKILDYNEQLGKCCATCLHLVAERYCSQKRKSEKEDVYANRYKYLVKEDIFKHKCKNWTNTWTEPDFSEKI